MMAVASVGLLFSQTGCGLFGGGSKEVMRPAAGNIAGEGTVEAKDGDNGNTEIEVRVKHLAAPAKVAADASVYVVWIRPGAGRIQNVGALEVDDELVGKLKTTTPHRAFKLTVTPEPSARMAEPTHEPVFTSDVSLED
jgi:hypothetical protein